LDLGFCQAGFRTIYANDSDSAAAYVYMLNLGYPVDIRDIRKVPDSTFPHADVLSAGFPCQPFSTAGARRADRDQDGGLFREAMRAVRASKPKVVVFENVPGILTAKLSDGRIAADVIESELDDAGYDVNREVVDASRYGVPQRRKRVFFLASLPPPDVEFDPALREFGIEPAIRPLPPFIWGPSTKYLSPGPPLNAILPVPEWVPDQEVGAPGDIDAALIPRIPEGGCWHDVPIEYLPDRLKRYRESEHGSCGIYRRRGLWEVAGTITASFRPSMASVIHPTEDRLFSVREAARIQSFPDSYRFPSITSAGIASMYRCIGNAVPPRLAYVLARTIKSSLVLPKEETREQVPHLETPVDSLANDRRSFPFRLGGDSLPPHPVAVGPGGPCLEPHRQPGEGL
jgi:DNA (cytosine-5)-methyltransferase 1